MDKFDEKKHESRDDRRDDERPVREGDILGLGGAVVPKAPGDPTASSDPEAAAQRRARIREGEAEDTSPRETEDNFGSTSIDMGAGGKGNTIGRG